MIEQVFGLALVVLAAVILCKAAARQGRRDEERLARQRRAGMATIDGDHRTTNTSQKHGTASAWRR